MVCQGPGYILLLCRIWPSWQKKSIQRRIAQLYANAKFWYAQTNQGYVPRIHTRNRPAHAQAHAHHTFTCFSSDYVRFFVSRMKAQRSFQLKLCDNCLLKTAWYLAAGISHTLARPLRLSSTRWKIIFVWCVPFSIHLFLPCIISNQPTVCFLSIFGVFCSLSIFSVFTLGILSSFPPDQ